MACCKKGSREAFTKIQLLTQSAALSEVSPRSNTRILFFSGRNLSQRTSWLPGVKVLFLSLLSAFPFLLFLFHRSISVALHVQRSRDEQSHAGDSMPVSHGLLPGWQERPWGKSLHSFAGACGLRMGIWELFSLVFWLFVFLFLSKASLQYVTQNTLLDADVAVTFSLSTLAVQQNTPH